MKTKSCLFSHTIFNQTAYQRTKNKEYLISKWALHFRRTKISKTEHLIPGSTYKLNSRIHSNSSWLLCVLRHHDHDLSLHDHFVSDSAGNRNKSEGHFDLFDLHFRHNLLSDVEGCRKAYFLVEKHAAFAGQLGTQNCWDQTINQHSVNNGGLERGCFGIFGVEVERICVPRQLSKKCDVSGTECFV